MIQSTDLISGAATADGVPIRQPSVPFTMQAYLSSAGGTATVTVQGRVSASAPWNTLHSFGLNGANDQVPYILDEAWYELRGRITVIGGGAVATLSGSGVV